MGDKRRIDGETLRRALDGSFLFRHVPPEERAVLIERATVRHYTARQPIFFRGDEGATVMAVLA
jgi:CRP-like cAMP-binding protein